MRIAVSSDADKDGDVSAHFGRSRYFMLFETDGKRIVAERAAENPHRIEHRPGAVPAFIASQNAGVLITGGAGPQAVRLLRGAGIKVVFAEGKARDAAEKYLAGRLKEAGNDCTH